MTETIFFIHLVEKGLWKLGNLGLQEVVLAWGLEDELKRLEDTYSIIKAMLLEAWEKQGGPLGCFVIITWLKILQDALYEAEIVLDEFQYQVLLHQAAEMNNRNTRIKFRNFVSWSNPLVFRFAMSHKIKKVIKKLDAIADRRTKFPPIVENERQTQQSSSSSDPRNVDESYVFGRGEDKRWMLQLLMTSRVNENISVIPVVGIGGIGKSTLVKLVYNDQSIIGRFHLRIWVRVAQDFNVKRVIQQVIRWINGPHFPCADLNKNELQTLLQEKLAGKRFLLVLDHVSNCYNSDWVNFREVLRGGANGSKIVVTTRSKLVASTVGTVPTYNLGGLSAENCYDFLLSWAGLTTVLGEVPAPADLIEIAIEFVKKCKGSPLAAKTLGNLLRHMRCLGHECLNWKDKELWELVQNKHDILPVLRSSYNPLPADLKRCFMYCSLFPKNYEIQTDRLIELWMAQGLLQPSGLNQELEDIGAEYVNQLCSIFFLDKIEMPGYLLNTCRMPEIIHDLAVSIAKEEYFCTANFRYGPICAGVKHVSFCDSDCSGEVVTKSIKLKDLRTILFPFQGVGAGGEGFVHRCITRFKYLCVLDFSDSCFQVLPDSIGNLKHLRFFDISGNANIETLPNTICKLYHLQTLRIWNCLKIQELPKNIGNLISLRHLYLTTQQSCLPEKEILHLSSLQSFRIAECGNLTSFPEGMHLLTALRTVTIISCPKLTSLPSTMKNLSNLKTLEISNCPNLNLSEWENFRGLRRLQ